jgi:hypothetical protein
MIPIDLADRHAPADGTRRRGLQVGPAAGHRRYRKEMATAVAAGM